MNVEFATTDERAPRSWLLNQLDLALPSFSDIRDREPLLAPLALATGMSLLTAAAWLGPMARAFSSQPTVLQWATEWIWIGAMATPLVVLVKAAVAAAVIWAGAVLLGWETRWRTLLSVFVVAELASLFVLGLGALVINLRPPVGISSPQDLVHGTGLYLLDPTVSGPLLASIYKNLGLNEIAWAAYLVLALPAVARLRRSAAVCGVLGLWVTFTALDAARVLFSPTP